MRFVPSPLLLILLLSLAAGTLAAQSVDTIRAAPGAVELRKLWEKYGPDNSASLGRFAGSLGDVYGIGRPAWAVHTFPLDNINRLWVYTWDTVTKQAVRQQEVREVAGIAPQMIVGRFIPDRRPQVLLMFQPLTIGVFPTDSFRVDTARIGELHYNYKPDLYMGSSPEDAAVADLDGDSLDDLVLFFGNGRVENSTLSPYAEIWIYRGGAIFPRSDTPDAIIRDSSIGSSSFRSDRLVITDIDGDQHLDIVTMGFYREHDSNRCTIYQWPVGQLPTDSVVTRHVCATSTGFYLRDAAFQDINGDKLPDYVIYHLDEPYKVYLYTSSPGRTLDKRVLTGSNADAVWAVPDFAIVVGLGPLNDTTGRWQMFALRGEVFSGGTPVPDAHYDATSGALGNRAFPLGDATGDGWPDVLSVSRSEQGYAALLAGGPEIPRDASAGVEWLAVTGVQERAVAVWPNPARDVVHIAWRGDLGVRQWQMEVRSMNGEVVARGEVAASAGAAEWRCSGVPTGSYVLMLRSETAAQPLSTIVHIVP